MGMVTRLCVMYPDGSINLMKSAGRHPTEQKNEAREEARQFNRGETDAAKLATFGEIKVDLGSFKEMI